MKRVRHDSGLFTRLRQLRAGYRAGW
jgi:hypothetical protein